MLNIKSDMFKALFIYFTIAISLNIAVSFHTHISRASISSLSMGGGRSVAEKGVTTKNMYKDLRSKFNEAAKKPGFFEVGDGPADIDLYCKSNSDGTQIGDCPFAQFVQV